MKTTIEPKETIRFSTQYNYYDHDVYWNINIMSKRGRVRRSLYKVFFPHSVNEMVEYLVSLSEKGFDLPKCAFKNIIKDLEEYFDKHQNDSVDIISCGKRQRTIYFTPDFIDRSKFLIRTLIA